MTGPMAVSVLEMSLIQKYAYFLDKDDIIPGVLLFASSLLIVTLGIVLLTTNLVRDYQIVLLALLLIVIFMVHIATAIMARLTLRDLGSNLRERLRMSIADNGTRMTQKEIHLWNTLQQHISCCGADSAKDWGDNLPDSCLEPTTKTVYPESCGYELPKILEGLCYVAMYVGITIPFIEALAVVIICIATRMPAEHRRIRTRNQGLSL